MLATSGGFVAICPKKEVELGADKLIHRADHAEELRQEIEFPCSKAVSNEYAHLCGGALRAINPNSSMTMAEHDTCAAVFKGNLFNKAELALLLVGCPPQMNEAQLLLHLYAAKGLDMLGMLQGQYAFCLYDSKQARVLAARDHSGAVPLLEGRTAAGSLIIACGTFLPEGVYQMVDIQPGEYKYGWHALPRQFRCGATKIVSGRASCDYGIRRRSIDAFNAQPSTPNSRGNRGSLDIPSRSPHSHSHAHGHSSSGSHTPGRYMPPYSAGAGGYYSRQRATSLDSGHWGAAPHVSASLPSPHGMSHFTGSRRRTSENGQHHPGSSNSGSGAAPHPRERSPHVQQQPKSPAQPQQHHAVKAPAARGPAVAAVHAPAAAAKAAAAALAAAAAATSAPAAAVNKPQAPLAALQLAIPAAAAANAVSPGSEDATTASEASTPLSAGGDLTSPHRRKRRHRARKHKGSSPQAGGGDAGASSDTESQLSTGTHDSNNSAPAAATPTAKTAPTPAGGKGKGAAAAAGGGHGSRAAAAPAGTAAPNKQHGHGRGNHHKQHQQQWQPKGVPQQQAAASGERRQSSNGVSNGDGGFKRNGSCGELAALAGSPTPAVLQAVPQGLAC